MSGKEHYSIALERDELNTSFGGGIPKNSLILFEGVDGAGKSVLCQRVIYSLLENGVKVTYISTEFNTLDFISQMESLNYSVRQYMLDNKLLFITMVPYLGKVKFSSNFLEKIMSSSKLFENEVLVFDSLSFLLVRDNADEEQYYDIMNFFRKLNNLSKTVIFTIDPTHLDKKFLNLLTSVVDVYLQVKILSFGGETIRNAEIKRFKRPYDLYKGSIPFRVEPREGLIIEIGSYS